MLSLFSWTYPKTLVYMLQNTEYQAVPYLKWYWRTTDFKNIARRRQLDLTSSARLLLLALRVGIILQIVAGLVVVFLWQRGNVANGWMLGLGLAVSYPVVWAHFVVIPLIFGRLVIIRPRQKKFIKQAQKIFANHSGIKIAVAGSYGKTSMKELLQTVLSGEKRTAVSSANKNTLGSLAEFAKTLIGNEEIIICEYGEGQPGDVAKFISLTHPGLACITGLAPAHLDKYPSVQAAGNDIFSLTAHLQDSQIYVNGESQAVVPFIHDTFHVYGRTGIDDWHVEKVTVSINGLKFKLMNSKQTLTITSQLLGRHQIGPLSAAVILALQLGLSKKSIEKAAANTKPYEHRMQPYQLAGAWVIDDTYNGNIEGVKAGLELLAELPASRKMYVTPGLVDQGVETQAVHHEIGRMIADARPERVVLMDNSVTAYIYAGLVEAGYEGELQIEEDPLVFYTNIHQFIAAGDLVLMQNDWTDNYH